MGTIWVQFYWWSSEVLIFTGFLYGGASRDRTDDLIVANDALSQLSYSPTCTGKSPGKILPAQRDLTKSNTGILASGLIRACQSFLPEAWGKSV